jgi:hypothetical protein
MPLGRVALFFVQDIYGHIIQSKFLTADKFCEPLLRVRTAPGAWTRREFAHADRGKMIRNQTANRENMASSSLAERR